MGIDSLLPIMGPRVLIRGLSTEDLEALYELEIDEDVKQYVGGPVTRPRQEWIDVMAELCSSPFAILPLIIACKLTGEFVGRASLSFASLALKNKEERCWEIQVLIAKKYWGRHLGQEVTKLLMDAAFDDLGALSVAAIVDPRNEASVALVKGLGFTYVSTMQSNRWDDGHYVFERYQTTST